MLPESVVSISVNALAAPPRMYSPESIFLRQTGPCRLAHRRQWLPLACRATGGLRPDAPIALGPAPGWVWPPPQPTPSPGPQAARPRVLLGPPTPGLPCAQWSPSSGPWDQAFLHLGPSGKHHSPFWPHFHHMWGPALGSRPIGNLARVDVTPGGGEPVIRELPGTWDALTAAL